jgi:hypothetical protein
MVTVPSLVDETPLDQYTATASQTDFNFTYMIFATEDIKVYVNGALKTETTDYVVKQSDGSAIVPADDLPMDGGKVVFNSGLTSGDEVSLSRDIAIERLTGYSVAGAFRADVVNAEFTKLYAVQQQLERDISRSVRLSDYDAEGGTFTLPENRASKFLAFDASGNMIAAAGSAGSIVVSSFMETVLDDLTAAAALTTLGISSYAQTLLDDANAAAARTTLAAQQDVITTRGDIVRGSSSDVAERLAAGTANQILTSDGTDVAWSSDVQADNLRFNDKSELTISSGSITISQSWHTVDTESDAATDDLTDFVVSKGTIFTLRQADSSRKVTVKHGSGIRLADDYDFDFGASVNAYITFLCVDDSNVCVEIGRNKQTINVPAFRATMSGDQNIGTSTTTKIQFNTEDYDTHSYYDPTTNYRFTPLVAGKYLVTVTAPFKDAGSAAQGARLYLYKNGAEYSQVSSNYYDNGDESLVYSNIVEFNGTTDYIEAYGRIGGSGANTIESTGASFTATRLF